MAHHDQMSSPVRCLCLSGVNLIRFFTIFLNLKRVGNLRMPSGLLLHVTFLENQWCVLLKIALLPFLLAILKQVLYYFDFFYVHGFSSHHLGVKRKHFSGLPRYYFVELSGIVLTWE